MDVRKTGMKIIAELTRGDGVIYVKISVSSKASLNNVDVMVSSQELPEISSEIANLTKGQAKHFGSQHSSIIVSGS